jgi:hypothetical protein
MPPYCTIILFQHFLSLFFGAKKSIVYSSLFPRNGCKPHTSTRGVRRRRTTQISKVSWITLSLCNVFGTKYNGVAVLFLPQLTVLPEMNFSAANCSNFGHAWTPWKIQKLTHDWIGAWISTEYEEERKQNKTCSTSRSRCFPLKNKTSSQASLRNQHLLP